MVKVKTFTKSGNPQAEGATLDKAIFGVEANHQLIKQAYNAYLSNGRSAQPNTLTRGLVRGGGKKPHRQKGTGMARVGSSRVPNWRGGGVVFGPTGLENHFVQLPIKLKRLALRQALSVQAADARVNVIEDFAPDGKTKSAAALLAKAGLSGRVLVVVADKTDLIDRSTRNLPGVMLTQAQYLNVFQVMNADEIVITKAALEQIGGWLGQKPPVKAATSSAKEPTAPKAAKTPPKSAPKPEATK